MMSVTCPICKDPMTTDTCNRCGVPLCPRHRFGNFFDPPEVLCHPCSNAELERLQQLPTPSRAEALNTIAQEVLQYAAYHGYTPVDAIARKFSGQGGTHTPGGLSYSYGSTTTYRDRKRLSVPKNSVVIERVHGTPCFEIVRYTEIEQTVREFLNPPPSSRPDPVQMEMFK